MHVDHFTRLKLPTLLDISRVPTTVSVYYPKISNSRNHSIKGDILGKILGIFTVGSSDGQHYFKNFVRTRSKF